MPAWMRSRKLRAAAPDCVKSGAVLPYRLRLVSVIDHVQVRAHHAAPPGRKSPPGRRTSPVYRRSRSADEATARPVGTVWERPSRRSGLPPPRRARSRPGSLSSFGFTTGQSVAVSSRPSPGLSSTGRADEGIDDGVLSTAIADHHQHAPGKAALSRRAEARADQGGQAEPPGRHRAGRQVVLRSAVRLNALAVSRCGAVDRLGHRRGADEGSAWTCQGWR